MAFKIFSNIKELFNLKKSIASKTKELNELQDNIKQLKNETYIVTAEKVKIEKERDNEIEKTKKNIEDTIQQYADEKDKIIKERDNEIEKTKKNIEKTIDRYKERTDYYKNEFIEAQSSFIKSQHSLNEIDTKIENQNKKIKLEKSKLKLIRNLQEKLLALIDEYEEIDINYPTKLSKLSAVDLSELDKISATFELPLHSFDIKTLRALSKENNKMIDKTLLKCEKRYTNKSNKAIYQLMVIALRAELQNSMIYLKFNTVDKCKNKFSELINKYFQIAANGNQTIAPTLNTFISEIKILFEKSIDIEYEYYVKKEQERAEQQALKEQMRQEAEERKELERQQKLVEQEEEKFKTEIEHTQEQINICQNDDLLLQLQEKIKQLQKQLQSVEEKKEEIINLQNGKAGYVYIISNLGSFGDNRFKIGMTRRINPIERVNELGSASVPFKFDVHSFIFSEDAIGLERSLHNNLSDKRTNKVNLRKEFFDISIDELENLVQELDPTAEFNRTMLATECRQSLSVEKENNYV